MLYGIDYLYIVLVLPCVIFALWAEFNVKTTFSKYSKTPSGGMTGAESARRILDENGLNTVRIARVEGELTDHYDPTDDTIYLSESVFDSPTAAAVGVAAHEAGHAVQHATNYTPMNIRAGIIPITKIGSNLAMPLILIGIIFSYEPIAMLGVLAFGLSTLFQLVTLPVEFDASNRAPKALRASGLPDDRLADAKKVLKAAALTYVAALAVSLANLLRLYLIVSGSNNKRRK